MTKYFAQLLVAVTAIATSNALNIEDSTKPNSLHSAKTSLTNTGIEQTTRNS
jgi:hypothetical protein